MTELACTLIVLATAAVAAVAGIVLSLRKERPKKEDAILYLSLAAALATAGLLAVASVREYRVRKAFAGGERWELVSDRTIATLYNAVPSQCDEDCLHTASMFTIDPSLVGQYRILAMERTMMAWAGISYGDTVLVVGAGRWDGIWQVEDTMNKRFEGQHKIDFLVPDHIRHGRWTNVKVYKKTKTL